MDYFVARYYGSNMGRFTSPDPSVLDYADFDQSAELGISTAYAAEQSAEVHMMRIGLGCVTGMTVSGKTTLLGMEVPALETVMLREELR